MDQHLNQLLGQLRQAAKARGVCLVACLADYGGGNGGAHFSTVLSLSARAHDVPEDDVVCDAVLEVMATWANGAHRAQLV